MDIYYTDSVTGEFLWCGNADPSPLEPGKYLIPAHAMLTAPPATVSHQAAVAINDIWSLVDDYRGVVYWMPDGSKHQITVLGVTPPAESTATPPPEPAPVLSCTAYQIRQALSVMGLRDAAEAAIAASTIDVRDAWEYETLYRRDNPKIAAIATALNKTDTDIDALFQLAITLSP